MIENFKADKTNILSIGLRPKLNLVIKVKILLST